MKGLLRGALVIFLISVASSERAYCVDNTTCDCYWNRTKFYPTEVFTECQIGDGAVIFHVFGMLYMFTALALICDEFFVPALEVIIEVLGISDDVAGATFMAAGGSAPEFFTSVIGVFISDSQVGVGTIIGSAVFNVLFVIGMCAVFSKELLTLTWWPLFRDVTFYSIGLILLIISFLDQKIVVYEAAILFTWYFCYIFFMKFNESVERFVKSQLGKLPCNSGEDVEDKDGNIDHSLKTIFNDKPSSGKSCNCQAARKAASESLDKNGDTEAMKTNGDAEVLIPCNNPDCLNSKVTQFATLALCVNTLDPVGKATFNDRVGELQRLQKIKPQPRTNRSFSRASLATLREHRFSRSALMINLPPVNHTTSGNNLNTLVEEVEEKEENESNEEEEEREEPLDLSWPSGIRAQFFYLCLAPILFPLAFSTPDVRRAKWKMFFPVTFIMSIVWIAVFSYLMVWWTETLGRTIGLGEKPEIMGLTLIAAGTSVPDLITSVIVARKGLGDMAVSSSLGSNLFDICVGLPVPWLIALAIGQDIVVDASGMFCSVLMLFAMLIAIIMIIAINKWRMTKILGFSMFASYFAYLAVALMMGLGVVACIFDKK